MTFEEVRLACEGYERRNDRMKELPRLIAGILFQVHGVKEDIQDMYPLSTDARTRKKLLTKEEFQELKNRKVEWRKTSQ